MENLEAAEVQDQCTIPSLDDEIKHSESDLPYDAICSGSPAPDHRSDYSDDGAAESPVISEQQQVIIAQDDAELPTNTVRGLSGNQIQADATVKAGVSSIGRTESNDSIGFNDEENGESANRSSYDSADLSSAAAVSEDGPNADDLPEGMENDGNAAFEYYYYGVNRNERNEILTAEETIEKWVLEEILYCFPKDEIIVAGLVEPLLPSVSGCSIKFQTQLADSPVHLKACVKIVVDYMCVVDAVRRLNAYYVLHDLVQREPRARIPFLMIAVARLATIIGSAPEAATEPYRKTITVWRDRRIFPSSVCSLIEHMFKSQSVAFANEKEFEQRLTSLIELVKIRATKDYEMEGLCFNTWDKKASSGDSNNDTAAVATVEGALTTTEVAAILAADAAELASMEAAAQAALSTTDDSLEYIGRLLLDYRDIWRTNTIIHMQNTLAVLDEHGGASLTCKDMRRE